MSRKPTIANENAVQLLKEFVQKKAHIRGGNFAGIRELQSLILKETQEYLSTQTLNRFFGLVKNDFNPSAATLDVLSKFVQYNSFEEFQSLNRLTPLLQKDVTKDTHLILSLFSNLKPKHPAEKGLLDVVKNICLWMEKDETVIEKIYPAMAASEAGRKYFYQQFINLDALGTHYGDGLHYFLLNTSSREDRFFAYSLLCFRYFLCDQKEQFDYYYKKVSEYSVAEVNAFHPFCIARYFSNQLFYDVLHHHPLRFTEDDLGIFQQIDRTHHIYASFPGCERILGLTLLLAKEYSLAWMLLQEGSRYLKNIPDYMDPAFINEYEFLLLYASYCSKKISKAKASEKIAEFDHKPFYFLSKNLYTILKLQLMEHVMVKPISAIQERKQQLIERTGFVIFKKKADTDENIVLMEIKGKEIV